MNNGTIKVKEDIDYTTFYKNSPPKICVDCGFEIEGQLNLI